MSKTEKIKGKMEGKNKNMGKENTFGNSGKGIVIEND